MELCEVPVLHGINKKFNKDEMVVKDKYNLCKQCDKIFDYTLN